MKNKYQVSERTLAIIGWAMYYKNYTEEQINNLKGIEILMLKDEYNRWLEEDTDKIPKKKETV